MCSKGKKPVFIILSVYHLIDYRGFIDYRRRTGRVNSTYICKYEICSTIRRATNCSQYLKFFHVEVANINRTSLNSFLSELFGKVLSAADTSRRTERLLPA